jgi:hypothetical protein
MDTVADLRALPLETPWPTTPAERPAHWRGSCARFHITAIAVWFVTLAVVVGVQFSLGVAVSATQILTVLLVGCVPAIVLIVVFRGAPRTIGQLLYETDQKSSEANSGEKPDAR